MPILSRLGIALAALLAFAAIQANAQVYKWRDDRGVVHYAETPPAGVAAVPVDARPYGAESGDARPCHTIVCQGQRMEEEKRRQAAADAARAAASHIAVAQAPARGMEFEVFVRLHNGMSEGELLQRAGPPDFQQVDEVRPSVGRTYYYYPTTANPFTTIVTLRGGRIFSLERIRKF